MLKYTEARPIDIIIGDYYKKSARHDCCEATIKLYLFILLYSCVHEGYYRVMKLHMVTVLRVLPIHGVITYVYSRPMGVSIYVNMDL